MRDGGRSRGSEALEHSTEGGRERSGVDATSGNGAVGRGLEEETPPPCGQLARPAHGRLDARLPPDVSRAESDHTLEEIPSRVPASLGLVFRKRRRDRVETREMLIRLRLKSRGD